MRAQAGFDCARSAGDKHTVELKPFVSLVSDDDAHVEYRFQVPTKCVFKLSLDDRAPVVCTCLDSPTSASAAYVDYSKPEAPLRLPVAPNQVVRAKLVADQLWIAHAQRRAQRLIPHEPARERRHKGARPSQGGPLPIPTNMLLTSVKLQIRPDATVIPVV